MGVKTWIKKTFSESNGTPSEMRQMLFLVVVVFLFNWTYCIIKTGQFIQLDFSSIATLVSAFAAKWLQKGQEGPGNG